MARAIGAPGWASSLSRYHQPTQDAGDIGQRIPFDLEEAEIERDRVEPEVLEVEMLAGGGEKVGAARSCRSPAMIVPQR